MRKQKVEVRIAKPEDAEAIHNIQKIGWMTAYPSQNYGITEADILSKFSDKQARIEKWKNNLISLDKNLAMAWVAIIDSKVVGFCVVKKGQSADAESASEISSLYVLPDYHNLGIGSSLIKQGLGWFGSEPHVKLNVVAYNSNAIKFYEKHGFIKGNLVHRETPSFQSGKDMPSLEMTCSV